MSFANESIEGILRAPLKFLWLIPLLNYTVIWKMVSKGGAPFTKPRPIGMARPKREIKNFAGLSLERKATEGILPGPLEFTGMIPLLNYTVI